MHSLFSPLPWTSLILVYTMGAYAHTRFLILGVFDQDLILARPVV
jgi:hypothetical protein